MAMIYTSRPLSGLQITPAVTLGFASRGVFSPNGGAVLGVQLAGAICTALFLQLMFGDVSAGECYVRSTRLALGRRRHAAAVPGAGRRSASGASDDDG